MDILVKIERFQIKQNVINLKSTLERTTLKKKFNPLYLHFRSSGRTDPGT